MLQNESSFEIIHRKAKAINGRNKFHPKDEKKKSNWKKNQNSETKKTTHYLQRNAGNRDHTRIKAILTYVYILKCLRTIEIIFVGILVFHILFISDDEIA